MSSKPNNLTRRDFVKKGSATVAVAAAAANVSLITRSAYAQGNRPSLKLGIVGCGGRGAGAVANHMAAARELDFDVKLVAMADLALERVNPKGEANQSRYVSLKTSLGEAFAVTEENVFVGMDAYQKVCQHDDVDVIIQTTPPGLRYMTLQAAVANGKHSFIEKPVCVDVDTYRSVLASAAIARASGLAVVTGTQYRRENSYKAGIEALQGGVIGDLTAAFAYYCGGTLWHHGNNPAWSQTEYQMRNWLYFPWLSGDLIAEQSVHNIDAINWAMGGPPVSAYGSGGRIARTDKAYGYIYDHFAVDYEYANGVRCGFMGRQYSGAASRVENRFVGTKGTMDINPSPGRTRWIARDHDGEVIERHDGRSGNNNPYVEEHKALLASIVSGEPIEEVQECADSSLTAVLGREICYSGKPSPEAQDRRSMYFDWLSQTSTLKLRPESFTDEALAARPEAYNAVRIPGDYQCP